MNKLEDEIVKVSATKNAETIKEHIGSIETSEGRFWKIKQKMLPNAKDPPMAKRDEHGNIIPSHEALKDIFLQTYKNRLRQRKMKDEYEDLFRLKNELWYSRLDMMRSKKKCHGLKPN